MHTGTDTQLGRWSQSTIPTDCCSDRKRRARARSTPAPLRHAAACSQPAGQPQRRRTGAQIARNTICTVLLGTWRGGWGCGSPLEKRAPRCNGLLLERVAFTRYLPGKLDSLFGICMPTLRRCGDGQAGRRRQA